MDIPNISGLEAFEPISRSSTSYTWRAYQRDLGRHVMVKVLLPEAAQNSVQADNFHAVSRAVSRVKAQSFCQVYDISTVNGQQYVLMEEAPGKTLAEIVQENPKLPARTVVRYGLGIAEALGRAWELEQFVHRNLKPTTITITPEGVAKLTDFGNAFLAKPGVDLTALDDGMIVGTPNFIAPEQVTQGHAVDHRSDMYALGMVLYYALTGVLPFGGEESDKVLNSQVHGILPNPRNIRPDLPVSACLLLERLLMKHPGHRYRGWGEVVVDMKRLIDGKPLRSSSNQGAGLSSVAVPAVTAGNGRVATKGRELDVPHGSGGMGRLLLWLLLLLWLVVYANHRLGDPADFYGRLRQRLPVLAPYIPVIGEQRGSSAAVKIETVEEQVPLLKSLPVPQRVPEQRAPAPAKQEATEERSADNAFARAMEKAAVKPPEQQQQESHSKLNRELVMALRDGGVAGLQKVVEKHYLEESDNARLRAMNDILRAVRSLDDLAAYYFAKNEGEEVEFEYKGKRRLVVPRGVSDGKVSLYFGEQNRTVTLALSSMDNREKLSLLGQQLEPHQAVTAVMMLLEAGDREAARRYIAATGPLAPVFRQLINK
ncbi:MAG: serine/threonine protein kinase [Lentisphaerae bacterium]|jgi:hypothetical protein|nr:serine/threonine protein kinase [Lentisphaerota bacterium]